MITESPTADSTSAQSLAQRVKRLVKARPEVEQSSHAGSFDVTIIYDFAVLSGAIFILGLFVLNLMLAARGHEQLASVQQRQAFQSQYRQWQTNLQQQTVALSSQLNNLQQLIASDLRARTSLEQSQLSKLRELIVTSQKLAATLPAEFASPDQSENARKINELRAQLAKLSQRYAPDHPELKSLNEEIRQLETASAASDLAANDESDSQVKVITNQYLRPVSLPSKTPTIDTQQQQKMTSQYQALQANCNSLSTATEQLLAWVEKIPQQQQLDQQQGQLWSSMAPCLRQLQLAAQQPPSWQSVSQSDALAAQSISPKQLGLVGVLSLSLAGLICYATQRQLASTFSTPKSNISTTGVLTIDDVTKTLGTAPLGIVSSPHINFSRIDSPELSAPETVVESANDSMRRRLRLSSELLLGVVVVVTVIMACSVQHFGGWLVDNPLSAWGRYWSGNL
jgi:hypothetical protein